MADYRLTTLFFNVYDIKKYWHLLDYGLNYKKKKHTQDGNVKMYLTTCFGFKQNNVLRLLNVGTVYRSAHKAYHLHRPLNSSMENRKKW